MKIEYNKFLNRYGKEIYFNTKGIKFYARGRKDSHSCLIIGVTDQKESTGNNWLKILTKERYKTCEEEAIL